MENENDNAGEPTQSNVWQRYTLDEVAWDFFKKVVVPSPLFDQAANYLTLLNELKDLLQGRENLTTNRFKFFFECLEKSQYARALRSACTCDHPLSLSMINILLKYQGKNKLDFDIDEQGGDNKYSAMHHAAIRGFEAIYQLLYDHGADENLKDNNQKTPKEYLTEFKAQRQSAQPQRKL